MPSSVRTMAYPRESVALGDNARRLPASPSRAARLRSTSRPGARVSLAASAARLWRARSRMRRASRPSAVRRRSRSARSSRSSGTTRRAAAVGVDARASAARSQSGVSCSWPTADTIGTGQPANARTTRSSLKGRRSSKLPPPRATTMTSISERSGQLGQRRGDRAGRVRSLHVGLRDQDPGGGKTRAHGGDEVALRCGLVSGQEPDPAGEERERPLALGGEQALGRERLLQPLDPGEGRAEADRLERERAEAEAAARLEELGPAEDVHAVAVGEVEA